MARSTALGDVRELVLPPRRGRGGRARPSTGMGRYGDRAGPRLPVLVQLGFPGSAFHAGACRRPRTRFADWARLRVWPRAPRGSSPPSEEFDQVRQGEILVCRMTNPAWVVLFTKIAGLVDRVRRQRIYHPAVVAREFGIPAVVGTQRCRRAHQDGRPPARNGTTGIVDIMLTGTPPRDLEEALLLREVLAEDAMVHAGGTFLGILHEPGPDRAHRVDLAGEDPRASPRDDRRRGAGPRGDGHAPHG